MICTMLNRNDLFIFRILRVTNLTSSGSGHEVTEILLRIVHLLSKQNLFKGSSMGSCNPLMVESMGNLLLIKNG